VKERRNYLLLMGAIAAALVGALLLAIPGSPIYRAPVLGLDLQGGIEVVLRAIPPKGQQVETSQMQTAQNIIESRVNKIGVTSPNVAIQGTDEIVIQLAGIKDPNKAAKVVGTTGQLQIFDFEPSLAPPTVQGNQQPAPFGSLYKLLTDTAVVKAASKGAPEYYYLAKTVTKPVTTKVKGKKVTKTVTFHEIVQGPTQSLKQLLLPYKHGKQPKNTTVLKVPAGLQAIYCKATATNGCPGAGQNGASASGKYWYLFKLPPALTGKDLVESGITADVDQNTGSPIVTLQFTGHGSSEFKKITEEEFNRGRVNAGQAGQLNTSDQTTIATYAGHNAIVLDGRLVETPYIDYTDNQLSQGIAGNAQISEPTTKAAQQTALVLQSGSLPYRFQQIESTTVTATLGKASLHQAILAAAAGLLIVALFLLVLYRFLGLVAVFGLVIYGLLYYAAILLFNVTLTLPGFAGMILTIGVAADANVVVFERIKEEVRAGRSVRAAIAAGYGKGFHTILDANVVTVITAMVIFLIAVADVKGFALMLLIGTVISLITAVFATRAMLGLLSGFKWFDNPRFMGAEGQQTANWLQIDFMGKRRLWFALSGVVILAGIVSLGVRGLNLGIDFKGGSQLTFSTSQPLSTGSVTNFMKQNGQPDAVVQGVGKKTADGDFVDWQVRASSLKAGEQRTLTQSLRSDLGASKTGVKNVSGTFGHQIAIDAIYGIVVSLLLITIYIAIRFDRKFAMPVILAMIHDILVTIGVYSISGREVSVATVAAVLTVLGYSIYDTIIIFDRVRENIPLMRRSPFSTIANVSLWETIRRSLATTFITLLPIICLYILGGAELKDFAFALIVGVTSGAYSSIFFAAPILTIWKEREPEYARRKVQADAGRLSGVGDVSSAGTVVTGTAALAASEEALSAESTPELVDVVTATPSEPAAQARREKRRQRRRSRPHGRAR
jgi:SecD/SecF fusion protein